MLEIKGYRDFQWIAETPRALVHRALHEQTGQPVVIKVLKVHQPSPSEIARFRHEFELVRKLDLEGVVQLLDLIFQEDRLALVMEDFGGLSLKQYLKGAMPLERFLDLAVRLAEVVRDIHQRHVIHRDIKPGNILYNPDTHMVKLTDFGIAIEATAGSEGQTFEGSLAYMSPEQTGRLNRGVDYRTDFYSLGATFYEMLTGGPPFAARQPMELVHAHIAREPVPPHRLNPRIPEVVAAIVLRLLAKSAEERYQSGQGLLFDLKHCQDELAQTGRISAFELARRDIAPKFHIPQVLVGREAELADLRAAFERAATGTVEIVMVTGEAGIGKSALINEILKPIVARRGYFINGKYDPLRQNVPYSAIIQALQGLARQLLRESEGRVDFWRDHMLEALGSNGRIMTDMVPEIERIIGPQPEVPVLPPEEAQNRFTMVLRHFMRIFADREHPLVLFLDDLQWADPASLDLLQTLLLDRQLRACLFIGAFRADEVGSHHPLRLALDHMAAAKVRITAIELKALDLESITRLLAVLLRCDTDQSRPLAALVHQKTLGNPFFYNQFLKSLYEDHYLRLDPAAGWQWEAAAIQKVQVTDNVVRYMAEKLRHLPPAPLALIQIAACIGNRFDIETLAAVSGHSLEAVLDILDTLVREGLITWRGQLCRFHHDRIHEAAYSLLGGPEQQALHYRIGRLALDGASAEVLRHQVFYIADQLNKARAEIKTPDESLQLAQINLKAGVKAKEATAYDAAVDYLHRGLDLLPPECWRDHYSLTYALHMEQMECQYLARNFPAAENLFGIITAHASGKIDQATAYNAMIVLYTHTRPPEEAIALGLSALRLFGIRLKSNMGQTKVLCELVKARWRLGKISLEEIERLPMMTDPERIAYHKLLFNIGTPAYFLNPNLFAFLVLKGVNEALGHGLPDHAAVTFMSMATLIENVLGDYATGFEMAQMALRLNQRIDNRKLSGMVHHIYAYFIQHWNRHAKHDLPVFRQVYQRCLEHGNFIYAGHGVNAATDCRLMIGEALGSILKDNEKYKSLMARIKDPFIAGQFALHAQLIRSLKGLGPDSLNLSGPGFDESAYLNKLRADNHKFGLCFTLLPKARLLYLFGRLEEARAAAEEVLRHIPASMGTLTMAEYYFYYSLILAAQLANAATPDKNRLRQMIANNQRKLASWAGRCPENFRHKHDLVQAEWMAAGTRFREAPDYYHAAIRGARQNEYIHEEALACERLALYYLRHNALEEARVFMQRAHECYGLWGAAAKQRDIETRYAGLLPVRPPAAEGDTGLQAHTTQSSDKHLDLVAVMQVSQAISSEIMLDQLLQKTLHLAMTNAGAERGFLILQDEGRLDIAAWEDVNPTTAPLTLPLALDECQRLCHAMVHFVLRSHEPVILAQAAKEGAYANDPYIVRQQCKSMLCMPILNKGRLTGILYMENNLTTNAFTAQRLEILAIIASQAAISLENARLFEMATTDGLTKLFTHRYFQHLLDQEITRSQRYDRPFSLAMVDIDHFKQFNDSYGHQLGDDVLRRVARGLRENLRGVDMAARYGGEEFALILPETDLPQALRACEKIRALVSAIPIAHGGQALYVTVSIGVATFPHHATDKEALIGSADTALYASKRAGRNRVTAGEKSMFRFDRRQASAG
ncbi:MAG: diguanylate cyclase [Desulfobacteraceae bacterium]|nr:diguanylate cyclase [Desulfobacteraceae bacterium]